MGKARFLCVFLDQSLLETIVELRQCAIAPTRSDSYIDCKTFVDHTYQFINRKMPVTDSGQHTGADYKGEVYDVSVLHLCLDVFAFKPPGSVASSAIYGIPVAIQYMRNALGKNERQCNFEEWL